MSDELPVEGRLAGIDYGTKRIGIAISDAGRRIASPLENYERRLVEDDANHFRNLVKSESIGGFIVGLPIHLSGDESQKSIEARAFGQWLGEVTGLAVCFQDERFSSVGADELLTEGGLTKKKRKQRRDMLAAQIILASFLERGDGLPAVPVDDE